MFGITRNPENDWEAFEKEVLPLTADVFRVARWLAQNQTEAEDLVQETLTQALQSFHRYTHFSIEVAMHLCRYNWISGRFVH